MSGALSSAVHMGQVSVDVNRIGTRNSLVPNVAMIANGSGPFSTQAVSHNHKERTVGSVGDITVEDSQSHAVNGNSVAPVTSAGVCSKFNEGGVAEFRGPQVHGLVRFTPLNERESKIEASFDGLTPGSHSWSINEYGDVRCGAASTGLPYSPPLLTLASPVGDDEQAGGMLGALVADSNGHAEYASRSSRLGVWDIIGRSVVVYQSCHQELKNTADAVACAVIARSSLPGAKGGRHLCSCDGTVIWQSSC
ncbi:hypothetical protein R1sor_024082 [Riccia sorocarpa]|uniref:Superoxide dismutase copper/zinc binding domain-containing protein n=1 Tax=Riccia sorocarpa TaxID=122646 RepID=A0ABD3GR07_9MARC